MYDIIYQLSLKMFLGQRPRDVATWRCLREVGNGRIGCESELLRNPPHSGYRRDAGSPAGWRDAGLGWFDGQLVKVAAQTQFYLTSANARK